MKLKRKSLIIPLAVVAVLGVSGCILILNLRTANETACPIYVAQGDTFALLMEQQQKELYIEHPSVFRLMAKARGLDKNLHPGHYLMQPGMKYIDLVQKLYRGQQDPIRLTIGKFRTPQQLGVYLDSKLMHNDFEIPLDSFYIIRPDTYEVYWTVTPQQFMQRMRKEYDKFFSATNHQLTDKEIIVLASIVEEETNHTPEKPLIASVYLNRLKRGMPLQADPTVKYALGDFSLQRILNKHLATESPFNTYLHTGLPPAPICLPSKSSVQAVIDAPQSNYIYFCASDKMDGTHRFASTLAEHNRNAAAFHRALSGRGIR